VCCYHFLGGVIARKDQLRNRQKLVAAAREAFAEHGPAISLEEIARRAAVGPTTLYRHFSSKDDLIEAVLDDLVDTLRENAEQAMHIEDPHEAFRVVFTQSCDMSERDIATFAKVAGASRRADEHAEQLVISVVGPATSRLSEAGGLRPDITIPDVATLIRMAVTANSGESLTKAIEVILDGLTCPAGNSPRPRKDDTDSRRTPDDNA
jgi:AcrR family transcriptional regulator